MRGCGDGTVTVNELLIGVIILLESQPHRAEEAAKEGYSIGFA